MACGAFWSSWANVLQKSHERLAQVVDGFDAQEVGGCTRELRDVTTELDCIDSPLARQGSFVPISG